MTEAEVERAVLEAVRRFTLNESAAVRSRFEQDLRLGAASRQMLFASIAEAFAARGVSLPGHQFLLTDFLACDTPAAAAEAIRGKVYGAAKPAPSAPAGPPPGPPAAPAKVNEPARKAKPAGAKSRPVKKKPLAKKPPAKKTVAKRPAGATQKRWPK